MKLFKLLDPGGVSPCYGYKWPLPEREGEPGEWTHRKRVRAEVTGNKSGFLLFPADGILYHTGNELWVAEGRGAKAWYNADYKAHEYYVEQARLTRRVTAYTCGFLVKHAAWCVRQALIGIDYHSPGVSGLCEYAECGVYNQTLRREALETFHKERNDYAKWREANPIETDTKEEVAKCFFTWSFLGMGEALADISVFVGQDGPQVRACALSCLRARRAAIDSIRRARDIGILKHVITDYGSTEELVNCEFLFNYDFECRLGLTDRSRFLRSVMKAEFEGS